MRSHSVGLLACAALAACVSSAAAGAAGAAGIPTLRQGRAGTVLQGQRVKKGARTMTLRGGAPVEEVLPRGRLRGRFGAWRLACVRGLAACLRERAYRRAAWRRCYPARVAPHSICFLPLWRVSSAHVRLMRRSPLTLILSLLSSRSPLSFSLCLILSPFFPLPCPGLPPPTPPVHSPLSLALRPSSLSLARAVFASPPHFSLSVRRLRSPPLSGYS